MKPFKLNITAALALAFSAPALADYKTCMTYCMKEHDDFAYCHAICTDVSVKPETTDEADDAPAVGTESKEAVAQSPQDCVDGRLQGQPMTEETDRVVFQVRNQCDGWITVLYCMDSEGEYTAHHGFSCGEQVGNYFPGRFVIPGEEWSDLHVSEGSKGPKRMQWRSCFGAYEVAGIEEAPSKELNEAFNYIRVDENGNVLCPE